MNKKIEKAMNGKEVNLFNVYMTFGKHQIETGVETDDELDVLLEKEFGDEYTEIKEKYIEASRQACCEFAEEMRDLLDEVGYHMTDSKPKNVKDIVRLLEALGAPKELINEVKKAKKVEVCEVGCEIRECEEDDEEDYEEDDE